jgi:DNA topoisomerase VI subunit A
MNDDFGLINLGKKKKKRRLDNLKSIRSYSHIWLMLSKMNQLTRMQKHVSQREMFYCLTPRVKDQMESNRAIQEVVSIIQCPRECLGIFASSRGWIAGTLEWNEGYGWIDCAKSGTALQIPGILPSTLKV